MRKHILILTLVAIAMLVATPAMALQVHGGWGTSTEGCADCHVTHAADAEYLLKSSSGNTQTDACYACHGLSAAASPYDVKYGAITKEFDYNNSPRAVWSGLGPLGVNQVRPSYAGGFLKSFDFDALDDEATNAVGADLHYAAADSTHNVQTILIGEAGYNNSAWNAATDIPGGENAIPNDVFKCGSCHDPHGVDSADTDAGGAIVANPRLLRHTLPVTGANPSSRNNVTIAVDASFRSTSYGEDVNNWCGGCHNYFDAADNAGHSNAVAGVAGDLGYNPGGKYRHPMGIVVSTAKGAYVSGASFTSLGKGTPLSTDNKIMCLTCHRAHGSAATNASSISESWKKYDNSTGSGSALLRLKNRDVCYNCHGGAQANPYTP